MIAWVLLWILPIAQNSQIGKKKQELENQALIVLTLGLDLINKLYTSWMCTLVRITYNNLAQRILRLFRVNSVIVTVQKRSLWILKPSPLRLLVLVAAHPKLQSFVRLCAWSMLLLGNKPPLAHYPELIVWLATTLFKK
jgi:hypothetical protein